MVQLAAVGHHGGGHRHHRGPACRRRRVESERGLSRHCREHAVESSSSVSECHKLEKSSLEDEEHPLSQATSSTEQATAALRHDGRTAERASLEALLSLHPEAGEAVRSETRQDPTRPHKLLDRHKGLPSVTSATRQQQLARSLCLDEENRKTSSTAPAGVCRNTVPPPFAANNSPPAGISGSRQRACPLTPPSVCQDMVGGNNNNNNKNNRNGVSNITDKSLGVLCSPSAEGTTVVTIEDFYRARDGESGGSGRSISDRGRGNSGGGGGSGSGSGSGNGGRGGGGRGGSGGREKGTTGVFGWTSQERGGGSDASVAGEERVDDASADNVGVISLSEVRKIRQSLAVLREREALSLPRRSRNLNRGRVATAHIDAIIVALVQEGLRTKGPRADDGDGYGGGGGRTSSGVGSGSIGGRVNGSNRDGGNGGSRGDSSSDGGGGGGGVDTGQKSVQLTDAEVGSIIAYVDIDQSGEVDAQEFQLAISAAKQGKMSDARLAGCVLKVDDMLRLRNLRVRDVFEMLDADGNGTLSREELAEGLSMLSGHDRAKVIQRRQALRERRRVQQERGQRRRDKVASYLASLESPPEEISEKEPDFFSREATEESVWYDMVYKISDFAGDDNDDDDDEDDDGEPLAVKTNNVLETDAQLDQLRDHIILWKATASAAAANTATSDTHTCADAGADAAADTEAHEARRPEKNAENQTAARGVARGGGVCGGGIETILEDDFLEGGRGGGSGLAPSLSDRSAHSSSTHDKGPEAGEAAHSDNEGQRPPSVAGGGSGGGGGSARENTGASVGEPSEARLTNDDNTTENRGGNPEGISKKVSRRIQGPATSMGRRGVHESKGRRRAAAITAAALEAAKLAVKMRRLVPAAAAVAAVAGQGRGQGRGRGRGRGRARPLSPGARVARTPFFSLLSSSSAVGANARARCSPAERRAAIKPVVATARPGDNNNATERPRTYDLDDRFLRAYLQRRFERERLPRLFAARSGSKRHRYTVCNAFEIAKRQGARMPPVV